MTCDVLSAVFLSAFLAPTKKNVTASIFSYPVTLSLPHQPASTSVVGESQVAMAKEAPKQSLVGKSKNGGGGGKKTVPSSSKAVGSSIPKPSAASGKSIPKPSAPSRSSILEPGFASQGTSKGKPPASPKSRTAKQSKAGIVFPVTRLQNQLKKATGMRVNENAAVYMAAALEYITAEALELAGDQSFKGKRKRITPRDVMSGFRKDAEVRFVGIVCVRACKNVVFVFFAYSSTS